jgi:alpha-L-arabinofuranosidase
MGVLSDAMEGQRVWKHEFERWQHSFVANVRHEMRKEAEGLRVELKALREEVAALKDMVGKTGQAKEAASLVPPEWGTWVVMIRGEGERARRVEEERQAFMRWMAAELDCDSD